MPKNIFIDLNVILDVLQARSGYQASFDVIELPNFRPYKLCISAHMVTTFMYLVKRLKMPQDKQTDYLDWLLHTFAVTDTSAQIVKAARHSKVADYEDAVVEQAALASQAVCIVTRNIKDFQLSQVPALTPEDFLSSLTA